MSQAARPLSTGSGRHRGDKPGVGRKIEIAGGPRYSLLVSGGSVCSGRHQRTCNREPRPMANTIAERAGRG